MTWIEDIKTCTKQDTLDKTCQVQVALLAVTTSIAGIAVLIFTVFMCVKKQKVKPLTLTNPEVQMVGPDGNTRRTSNLSKSVADAKRQATAPALTGPKPDRPGQYFDRVTGKWVEDVDFSLEADGKVLKVINPEPGGFPNIPYDEKTTTDVPMTSYPVTMGHQPQVMIPVHYSMRRQLVAWGPPSALMPPMPYLPNGRWPSPQPNPMIRAWSNHGQLMPQTSGYQYWGPQQQQPVVVLPEYGNYQEAYQGQR